MCYEARCPHQDYSGECCIPSYEFNRPGFKWPCPHLRDDEDEVPVEDPDEGPQIVFIEIPNVKE
jgi:hypothetical protein